jgi:MFS family permease
LFGFVSAYTVNVLGDRFGELALPLVVLAATGDPAAAGLVAASIHVPGLLLALWLGAGVDRHPRRQLMIVANLVRAACLGAFAWLAATSVTGIWAYLLVGLALGSGNILFGIAGFALLPQLVQGSRLVRANAMLEAGDAAITILGPPAAGAVIARLSAAFALVLNAVSYLVSALLLLVVRVPPSAAPQLSGASAPPPGVAPAGCAGCPRSGGRTWQCYAIPPSGRCRWGSSP